MKIIKGYQHFVYESFSTSINTTKRKIVINDLLNKEWMDVKITTKKNSYIDTIYMQVEFFIEVFEMLDYALSQRREKYYILQLIINEDKSLTLSREQYLDGYWYKINFKNDEKSPLMKKVINLIDNEIRENPSIIKSWLIFPEPFATTYPEYKNASDLNLF